MNFKSAFAQFFRIRDWSEALFIIALLLLIATGAADIRLPALISAAALFITIIFCTSWISTEIIRAIKRSQSQNRLLNILYAVSCGIVLIVGFYKLALSTGISFESLDAIAAMPALFFVIMYVTIRTRTK